MILKPCLRSWRIARVISVDSMSKLRRSTSLPLPSTCSARSFKANALAACNALPRFSLVSAVMISIPAPPTKSTQPSCRTPSISRLTRKPGSPDACKAVSIATGSELSVRNAFSPSKTETVHPAAIKPSAAAMMMFFSMALRATKSMVFPLIGGS